MLLTGLAVGFVNALLYVKGRMPHSFIPTLAMLNAASGLALLLSDGQPDAGHAGHRHHDRRLDVAGIPVAIIVVAALRAPPGCWPASCGGDAGSTPSAATARRPAGSDPGRPGRDVGVPHRGFCAAVAGIITAGRMDAGYPTAGQLQELASISAVIIGGASFWGGRGTVPAPSAAPSSSALSTTG